MTLYQQLIHLKQAELEKALQEYETPNLTATRAESLGVSRINRQTPNNGLPIKNQASDSRDWHRIGVN